MVEFFAQSLLELVISFSAVRSGLPGPEDSQESANPFNGPKRLQPLVNTVDSVIPKFKESSNKFRWRDGCFFMLGENDMVLSCSGLTIHNMIDQSVIDCYLDVDREHRANRLDGLSLMVTLTGDCDDGKRQSFSAINIL